MTNKFLYLNPEEIMDSEDFKVIEQFLKDTRRSQIGWHYIVDLTWIYSQAKNWPTSYKVLDAGGGRGPTQFLLAEMGLDVTNIDLFHLQPLSVQRKRYQMNRVTLNSYVTSDYVDHLEAYRSPLYRIKAMVKGFLEMPLVSSVSNQVYDQLNARWRNKNGYQDRKLGEIEWVVGNLCGMPEITDNSFDAVVSLSALEHIPINILPSAVSEINRSLKQGGAWAVTTSGTEQVKTWYHEPSKGQCFSEDDFERLFDATLDGELDAENAIIKYRESNYLKRNLSYFYKKSGDNGMPFGEWDPKYIPVGLYHI